MTLRFQKFLFAVGLLLAPMFGVAAAEPAPCGGEVPCELDGGTYYVHLPATPAPGVPLGAIFFLHGHRGKALNEIRNKSFLSMADELGVAFVALQGVEGTWSFRSSPRSLRDEPAFFDAVLTDLSDRFGVDRNRTLLSGFSSGAFMTWYLACAKSDRFAGYAPIAGAFWEPLPDNCPTTPPYLFHVHGTTDTVVPLAGRELGGGRWRQGDVFKSFDIWRRQAGLTGTQPEAYPALDLACERWLPAGGGVLELCLHGGGHSVRAAWIARAWHELAIARGWPDGANPTVHAKCRELDDKLTEAAETRTC